MAWWGKLIGGTFGFMLGGPLGAALGAVLGHSFDKGLGQMDSGGGPSGDPERIQAAFFAATFSVMGHVAKSDGRVSQPEIAMAEQLMRQMRLSAGQRRAAIGLFNEGKRSDFPLDAALEQFRRECHRRTTLLQMFLEIQIQAALADDRLHADENRMLLRVAADLGFSADRVEQLIHMLSGAARQRSAGDGRPGGPGELAAAYETLGVGTAADDAEVKRAYRRLMNQHHPDKLVAKGLPEEMVKLATEKTQQIRTAYERIKRARQ
jgi:DnaJ like chaperone protein